MKRLFGVLAGVVLAAGGLAAVEVAPAGADLNTLFDSNTPGEASATVPSGICSLHVVAIGGGGAGGDGGGGGGHGARVTSTLSVAPGQALALFIGGGGAPDTGSDGGGGGGGSTTIDPTDSTNRIIAGGGGGGGERSERGGDGGVGPDGAGGDAEEGQFGPGGSGGGDGTGGTAPPGSSGGGDGVGGPGGSGVGAGGVGFLGGGSGGGAGNNDGGGGGGGYGGGGGGGDEAYGGGAGGSTGPTGTIYATASNAGARRTAGGAGSITITYDPTADACKTYVAVNKAVDGPVPDGTVFEIEVDCSSVAAPDSTSADATPSVPDPPPVTLRFDANGDPLGEDKVLATLYQSCKVTETVDGGASTVSYECAVPPAPNGTADPEVNGAPVECLDQQTVLFGGAPEAEGTVTVTNTFEPEPEPEAAPAGVVAARPTFTG